MTGNRTDRLNSLLKEVISDVIKKEVKNPNVAELITVTRVDITKDLRQAKVYVSIIGDEKQKENSLIALESASGFIGVTAAKQVVMRFFPKLTFLIDDSVDKQVRIEKLLDQIHDEEFSRTQKPDPSKDDE